MEVQTQALADHLTRLFVGGKVNQVVLTGRFGGSALTEDQQLFVDIPELLNVDELPEDVGVLDLGLLIRTLKGGAKKGKITVQDTRMVVRSGKVTTRMLTAAPRVINTYMPTNTVKQIIGSLSGRTEHPFGSVLQENILRTTGLVKAEQVRINLGTDASSIVVGDPSGHFAEVEMDVTVEEPYALLFTADTFTSVLKMLGKDAVLVFTGEDSIIGFKDGDYTYVLSPLDEG